MTPPAPAKPRRRRHTPRATGAQPPPAAWKLWLGGVLFVLGGGAAAVWGILDTAAWIGALRRGDGVIVTESVILGLPLLGGGLCAIGPVFVFPRLVVQPGKRPPMPSARMTRIVLVMFGTMIAGIVLVPVGGLFIDLVMSVKGYRACDVHGHGRVTVVTWAGAQAACPPS